MIRKKGQTIRLDTPNTTLVIKADTAEYLYYGKKLVSAGGFEALSPTPRKIFSQYGENDYTEYGVLIENSDGGFSTCFSFSKSKILTEKPEIEGLPSSYGEGKTLELKYIDAPTKVCLYLYYTVFDDCDAIAVSSRIVNQAKKEICVRRLASLQLDLLGDYSVVTFEGAWARERQKISRDIVRGVYYNDSKKGMSSHNRNPFVIAEGEEGVYGFNLVYSGNHKEAFERDEQGRTRALVGMNDFMFGWKLAPGETFCAPEAVMCYAPSEDELSLSMHAFVAEHIVRGKWKKKERPVLVNNWEGTYFDFNEEKLLAIARAAKDAGAELFVLDDGWFGKRDDDTSSLGDWTDNADKTGGGLANLADKIRELGLEFGIWVEPEMISEDSELYRSHPNFAMKVPGREPTRLRNQLCLNLADERVQNYVVRSISDVIARSGAAYVKWDYNRSLTDCYAKGVAQGEYFHRYMLGFYRIAAKLTKKFPFVLFEGCAGGGGRFDLGTLCYFPQFWTSDNTDARARLKIQDGTSYGYPQTVMTAHVSACPNHQTGDSNPLETRFNVACGGVLGYELDMSKLSESDFATAARQIEFYKKNRKLFQFGTYYRLGDVFSSDVGGFMVVSRDKSCAAAVVSVSGKVLGGPVPRVAFKGLAPSAVYDVTTRPQDNYAAEQAFSAGGDLLMNGGIFLRDLFEDLQSKENSGCLYTRMYLFKKNKI